MSELDKTTTDSSESHNVSDVQSTEQDNSMLSQSFKPDFDAQEATQKAEEQRQPQDIVMVLVGKWAMPTTVVLVLITCLSGYYLNVEAFTPVVGMIAPVVMALIMVIKEASLGQEQDESYQDRERERSERRRQLEIEKELKLAQLAYEERRFQHEMQEKIRQFDKGTEATQDFVALAKDMNSQLAELMRKETELVVGDTRIKLADGNTQVAQENEK
ncbi:hypothetical protein [Pseudoalteromonas luteoviolacea]|uniref:Uncharacterized protein n=1 Tax=Pseudoalteromonas luteoviolacea DSM 6061 TaxID=1365250 RepID=A0A166WXF1_9GAMM|nr:hypothetical protein [Pseudoalteromonas luteoviolacea]KZN38780.1 hypothetical protein N475_15390 [Pseudoalteromonas luteoviolacea DSM 6061]MBE0387670.1 hypothetical protein [Pseudoalteromonas luteoviolacea DSM 6061]